MGILALPYLLCSLVLRVQHQQSEWLECRYNIMFLTLYQGEWLDYTGRGWVSERNFALFASLIYPFLLLHARCRVILVYTNLLMKRRLRVCGGHNVWANSGVLLPQIKTKARVKIDTFGIRFPLHVWGFIYCINGRTGDTVKIRLGGTFNKCAIRQC